MRKLCLSDWGWLTDRLDKARKNDPNWHEIWYEDLGDFASALLQSGIVTRGEENDEPEGEPACVTLRWLLHAVMGDNDLRRILSGYVDTIVVNCNVDPWNAVYEVHERAVQLHRTEKPITWNDVTARAHSTQIVGMAMYDGLYPEQLHSINLWWPSSNGILGTHDQRFGAGRLLSLVYRKQKNQLDRYAKMNDGFREMIRWAEIRWQDHGIELN